jgi:Transposase DDE domain
LITLIYTDPKGVMLPVNYAVAKTEENQNRNQLFRKMFKEVISWGLQPEIITFDNAYASWDNFRLLDRYKVDCLFSLGLDQQLYLRGQRVQVSELPFQNKQGKMVDCLLVGTIKIFQQRNDRFQEPRHYAFYSHDPNRLQKYTRQQFRRLRAQHWGIERYHRCIKQNCCIEKFTVRKPQAVLNHIFCSLLAFCQLEQSVIKKVQKSWYRLKTSIISHSLSQFIQSKNSVSANGSSFYTTYSLISPIQKLTLDSS